MDNQLKVAIVANTAWNVYNFRMGLIRNLMDRGLEVIVVAPRDKYVPKIQALNCRFIPLKHLARKGTNPVIDLKLVNELRRIYAGEKVDISLQFTIKPNIYGSIAGSLANTFTICTVTGLGYGFLNEGILKPIVYNLYRFAFRMAGVVVFQNKDDRRLFLDLKLNRAKASKIIPGSGIDTDYFAPRFNQTLKDGVIRFLFIGRLLYDKGIRELQEAIEMVEQQYFNVRFNIIGAIDEDNPSSIKERAFRKWLDKRKNVCYFGTTNNVRDFIAKADALILPSYREGLPRVMLEGMAMGKPLIATDVPGCRDTVVDAFNGYLVQVKNAIGLAEAIEQMIKLGPTERLLMGRRSRMLALKKFDERIIVDRYLDLIQQLAEQSTSNGLQNQRVDYEETTNRASRLFKISEP